MTLSGKERVHEGERGVREIRERDTGSRRRNRAIELLDGPRRVDDGLTTLLREPEREMDSLHSSVFVFGIKVEMEFRRGIAL